MAAIEYKYLRYYLPMDSASLPEDANFESSKFIDVMEKKVKGDVSMDVPVDTDHLIKLKLLIASGDIPDIVYAGYGGLTDIVTALAESNRPGIVRVPLNPSNRASKKLTGLGL